MSCMKVIRKFLPHDIADIAAFIFMVTLIPFYYCFETFVVLPTIHTPSLSFWYIFYISWFTFLLWNVTSNFTYIVLTDPSIRGKVMPCTLLPSWRFCEDCQSNTPPRSWHCSTCEICILKRDHHCNFTGCCIGHFNHRYFILFLAYMFISSVHAAVLNIFFVLQKGVLNPLIFLKVALPMLIYAVGGESFSFEDCYMFVLALNLFGVFMFGFCLIFQIRLLARGVVSYESSHKVYDFDLGSFKENVIQVLGERWYLTWISPSVTSKLPSNGLQWETLKLI